MQTDSKDVPGGIVYTTAKPAPPAPMTGPERMQREIDSLALRVRQLEIEVHRLLNPGEVGDDTDRD